MSYFVFKPTKNDIDPLAAFRAMCKEVEDGPIKRIVAVGMHYSKTGISNHDSAWLMHAIDRCEDMGFPVSANFELTPLDGSKQDFLSPKVRISTDLLMICYVFNPESNFHFVGDSWVSPHHFDKDAWYLKAVQSNAKLVFPYAKSVEIDSSHFRGPAYAEILVPSYNFLVRKELINKLTLQKEWKVMTP